MRALSRKLATPLRRHVLCPCRGLDCPRCFAQCEALRRTASVLNTHGYCICLVVCGGPAPAAARRPPPQAGAEPPARPELVMHGLRALAFARALTVDTLLRRPSAHWRWRRSLSHCAAPPRCMACSHTRSSEGMRCIFRNCGDFFRTRTTSRGTSSVHGPRGARETGGAGRARGGRGFRTAAHAHSRTRISVRDRLTTQPRPLLRRPTCGNPQRLMCCHRTRRPPCHA